MISVAISLATFSAAGGFIANFIQVRKVWVTKDTKGLSVWSTVLSGWSYIGWILYSVQHRIPLLVISNLLLLPLASYLVYRLARSKDRVRLYLCMVGGGIVFGVLLHTLSTASAGWLAAASMIISLLPQVYRALHDKRLTGISRQTQAVWLVIDLSNLLYSLLIHVYPLTAIAAVGAVNSIFLLYMTDKKR